MLGRARTLASHLLAVTLSDPFKGAVRRSLFRLLSVVLENRPDPTNSSYTKW